MALSESHIAYLLLKKLNGQLSPGEAAELEQWKNASSLTEEEFHDLTRLHSLQQMRKEYAEAKEKAQRITFQLPQEASTPPEASIPKASGIREIPATPGTTIAPGASITGETSVIRKAPVHRIHFLRRWGWAAAIVILLGVTLVVRMSSDRSYTKSQPGLSKNTAYDLPSGREGAVLTLSDGSQVVLDSLGNGLVASQNGAEAIIKNGELVYDVTGAPAGNTVYNTMSTPRGRQYSLFLPDGSRVWLNSASSIRYPTIFTGKERRVEVSGEAYFEVAKNGRMPFRVSVNHQLDIEVLGTSFNINAYDDESLLRTTLVDGRVRVSKTGKGSSAVLLYPDQQAVLKTVPGNAPGAIEVKPVDVTPVLAWKNGYFSFQNISIREMARQIERWYDIHIVFEGKPLNVEPVGKMDRGVKLSEVIQFFNNYGFDTRMEGRTLVLIGR